MYIDNILVLKLVLHIIFKLLDKSIEVYNSTNVFALLNININISIPKMMLPNVITLPQLNSYSPRGIHICIVQNSIIDMITYKN